MTYRYMDYTPEMETVIDSWLDDDGAYFTGFDEGFASFYDYWTHNPDNVLGENYWVKIICDREEPLGVVVVSFAEDVFYFAELLIAPTKRGNGIGTAAIRELLENGSDILDHTIDRAEACIYPKNTPSQKVFQNAGFRFDHAHPDGDIWYYRYKAK